MPLDPLSVTRHSSLSPCLIFIGGEWTRISGVGNVAGLQSFDAAK